MVPVVACSCGNLARSGELIDEIAYLFCTKPCDAPQILLSHTLASRPIRETHRAPLFAPFCRIGFPFSSATPHRHTGFQRRRKEHDENRTGIKVSGET